MKRRTIWILSLIGLLTLLALYSGATRPSRDTQIEDLYSSPKSFDKQEVYVSGRVIGSPIYGNGTVKIIIESKRGDETVLLIVNPSQLNTIPKQGDGVEAKGLFIASEEQTHVEVSVAHVRTVWGERFIFIRSFAAIPLIYYLTRKGWDLVRV